MTKRFCNDCRGLIKFNYRLKEILLENNASQSTLAVLSDCRHKSKLVLGHQLRVVNQQMAISQMQANMYSKCLENKGLNCAINQMDFKMKQEPMWFYEKTVDHYGKHGIS